MGAGDRERNADSAANVKGTDGCGSLLLFRARTERAFNRRRACHPPGANTHAGCYATTTALPVWPAVYLLGPTQSLSPRPLPSAIRRCKVTLHTIAFRMRDL